MQKGEEDKIKIQAEAISKLEIKDFMYHRMDTNEVISKLKSD